jgi:hypothetical protein
MFDDANDPHLADPPPTDAPAPSGEPEVPPGQARFDTCRWRCAPEDGLFCTHRDVLPFAGREGFNPEAWCPDCEFFKVRRTPKRRERNDYGY